MTPNLRALMICFAYPPFGGVGMIRPAKFAKYLPAYGVEVTVLTHENGSAVIECNRQDGEFDGVSIHRTQAKEISTLWRRRTNGRGSSPADGVPQRRPRW